MQLARHWPGTPLDWWFTADEQLIATALDILEEEEDE